MSGLVSIGGGGDGTSFALNLISDLPSTLNSTLQTLLGQDYLAFSTGSIGFENYDVGAGGGTFDNGVVTNLFEEISDLNSAGTLSTNAVSLEISIASDVQSLIVEALGSFNITADPPSTLVFSAQSDVNYTQNDGVSTAGGQSIYALGGNDQIKLLSDVYADNATIYGAGNDTVNLYGAGNSSIMSGNGANTTVDIEQSVVSIAASGNATIGVHFDDQHAGGSLYLVNNSSVAATIYVSNFGNSSAAVNVTAYGATGGGFFVGGQKNQPIGNVLIGGQAMVGASIVTQTVGSSVFNVISVGGGQGQAGTDGSAGVVTLVGGGSGDFLEAQGGQSANELFAGAGNETMVATSSTGANLFQVGNQYPGLGNPAGNGVISTTGSGLQSYFLGLTDGETIYGSSAGTNEYNIITSSLTGGSNYTIYNFNASKDALILTNAADTGAGNAGIQSIQSSAAYANSTLITLSDKTSITLIGISSSSIIHAVNGSGQTIII